MSVSSDLNFRLDSYYLAGLAHAMIFLLCALDCPNLRSALDLPAVTSFILMCTRIGVPLAPEKTIGPEMVLQFGGITLDSIRFEDRLPNDKLLQYRLMLCNFYRRRTVTLKELQSLIGLLNFRCIVLAPARAFLRRLIDLT